jgi:UDP-4-amino-4,6-dideoxy-N-acetyl-beta-L-altrosamine transaminase
VTFLPYGRQEITDADVEAVADALRGELITQGPLIENFERAMASYLGASHAVAVSSGTAALHASAFAAAVGPGDEVITTPLTFAASANCARYLGADVRFVDIDPATWNLDTEAAAAAVSSRTRAIIPVSYAGLPVNLRPLEAVRGRVIVIEDGCHAIGGHRAGVKVGGAGGADLTAFSFHPVKAMTTGEGGLVTTEDSGLRRRAALFRTHGITRDGIAPGPNDGAWYYEMQALGFNYRITDVQCALGLSQLRRLDAWVARRNAIACRYRELLTGDERIELPPPAPAGSLHGCHLFPIRLRDGAEARKTVFAALRAAGIGVQVHYIPVYRLPYWRDTVGAPQDACPHAEALYSGLISLPMFPALTETDQDRVVTALSEALR